MGQGAPILTQTEQGRHRPTLWRENKCLNFVLTKFFTYARTYENN